MIERKNLDLQSPRKNFEVDHPAVLTKTDLDVADDIALVSNVVDQAQKLVQESRLAA